MGFPDAIKSCLKKNYAGFQGRASRSEYWLFALFFFLAMTIAAMTGGFAGSVLQALTNDHRMYRVGFTAWVLIAFISLALPLLAVKARRLHDLNMSGLWLLVLAIPGIGALLFLGFLLPGSHGDNRFGPDPILRMEAPRQHRTFNARSP